MDTEDIRKHADTNHQPAPSHHDGAPAQRPAESPDHDEDLARTSAVQLARPEENSQAERVGADDRESQPMVKRTMEQESQQPAPITTNTAADRRGAPAVRLDMDLDVDIQLKAKIQGDITLAVLLAGSGRWGLLRTTDGGAASHVPRDGPLRAPWRVPVSRTMPSQHKRSPTRASTVSGEIINHLGRAALVYSLKRLSEQKSSSSSSSREKGKDKDHKKSSSHRRSRSPGPSNQRTKSSRGSSSSSSDRSRSRSRSRSRNRGYHDRSSTSRSLKAGEGRSRSDDSSPQQLISQVAVGIIGHGISRYLSHRREAKQKTSTKPPTQTNDLARGRSLPDGTKRNANSYSNSELSAALVALRRELDDTLASIRRLSRGGGPKSHRECEVRDRLVANADRLEEGIERLQASISNIMNLDEGLGRGRGRERQVEDTGRSGPVPGYARPGAGGREVGSGPARYPPADRRGLKRRAVGG
ncbi:hypothetical protein B0T22DRAFT_445792 [Podospora appendiculata]|uniref:Uncharacterized protein n=1 Tax=Podospora appendiculata TaxID=314037 RepID=A0AAE0WZM8_9PEZI|nr:hypothetical protein B0T22DRAFT_445792 [Podospora appendiculata]